MKLADDRLLFDAMPPGVEMVELVGGGEPLVHPDAVEIMRDVKRRGWRGSLITNATLLREPVARALVAMRWDTVRASVHAADRATYAAIQGGDRFDVLCENLRAYDAMRRELPAGRRPGLAIYNVIQRENVDTIERLFEFGAELGADLLVFEKIIPYSDPRWMTVEEVRRARARRSSGGRRARRCRRTRRRSFRCWRRRRRASRRGARSSRRRAVPSATTRRSSPRWAT